jgi:hypothetical protein
MKLAIFVILICLFLLSTGCSIVQWIPSSNCDYVEYIRVGNEVNVKAECKV